MYFVYILVCLKTGRSYVGHTDDIIRRFRLHREGSTRTTREKLDQPVMVHWEPLPDRSSAARKERYYKSGSGHRVKQELVRDGLKVFSRPDWNILPNGRMNLGVAGSWSGAERQIAARFGAQPRTQ
jgi:predicted GIY-YIG superfamily endonuclease